MSTMVKVQNTLSENFTNDEYTTFAERFFEFTGKFNPVDIGIVPADLSAFSTDMLLLRDIVSQSRISDQTVKINVLNTEINHIISFVFNSIDRARTVNIPAMRDAGIHLHNVKSPYVGIQRLSEAKKPSQVQGLVSDLSKEENTAAVVALKLAELIEKLDETNNDLIRLIAQRLEEQTASRLEAGHTVRARMVQLYDRMTNLAFAKSITAPTDKTTEYITGLNALINATNAAYHQRIAQQKVQKAKTPSVVGTTKGVVIHNLPRGEDYKVTDIAGRIIAQGTSGGATTDIATPVGEYTVFMLEKEYKVVVK